MKASFNSLHIRAIAGALPQGSLDMRTFQTLYGLSEVKRVIKGTGISQVRVADRLTTGALCEAAARSLLSTCQLDASAIDGLIVVTQTPDSLMPGTGSWLQSRLSLSRRVAVVDINSGCSGFIYGLYQAAMMIASGGCNRVLLLTGDVITKLLGREDRHVRMVFGDAAAATLVERGESALHCQIETDGHGARHLGTALSYGADEGSVRGSHLHMNGAEVMGFAVSQVPPLIASLLCDCRLNRQDIPLFVMHQANDLILTYLRRQLQLDKTRLPIGVDGVGNTGPSSIPLFLAMHGGTLDQTILRDVVLCGFGVGLSLGAAMVDLRGTLFIPPVNVDEPVGNTTASDAA